MFSFFRIIWFDSQKRKKCSIFNLFKCFTIFLNELSFLFFRKIWFESQKKKKKMSNEGEDAPPATAEVPEETPPGKKFKKI